MITLLTSALPLLKCKIHTDSDGTFSLCCTDNDPSKPNIQSLSFLMDDTNDEQEMPLFFPSCQDHKKNKKLENTVTTTSEQFAHVFKVIRNLDGIQLRLHDVATAPLNKENTIGYIEEFLQRSEAVVTEVIYAMQQFSQRNQLEIKHRSLSRLKSTSNTDKVSAKYISNFLLQLDILHQIEIKTSKRIIENINDALDHISLICLDDGGREHKLLLQLPSSFPMESPTIITDLPIEFHPRWKPDPNGNHLKDILSNPNSLAEIDDVNNFTRIKRQRLSSIQTATSQTQALCTEKSNIIDNSYDYGLSNLYKRFENIISDLQPLWNELRDIDTNTWVLEPSLPARYSSVQRRVVLQTGISIVFTIDILNSSNVRSQNCESKTSSPPSFIRFIGAPASTIKELRSKYLKYINVQTSAGKEDNAGNHESFEGWRSDFSIRENFTKCFGPLPTPMTSEKSNFVTECGICYSHELPLSSLESPNEDENNAAAKDGEKFVLPDETCPNPKCARSFHECCLYLWLNSLPSVRITFDRIIGSCPYCSEPISAQVRS